MTCRLRSRARDLEGKRFTFNLKHKVPRIVRNRDNFVLIFKDVSRQKDFSRIDPKETRVMSAAHAEAVPINFDGPSGISSRFLIG